MADIHQQSGLDFIDNMDSTKNLSKAFGSGFASATNTNQFFQQKKSTQGDFGAILQSSMQLSPSLRKINSKKTNAVVPIGTTGFTFNDSTVVGDSKIHVKRLNTAIDHKFLHHQFIN